MTTTNTAAKAATTSPAIWEALTPSGTRYYEAERLSVTVYHSCGESVHICDLTDALRPGKTCTTWALYTPSGENPEDIPTAQRIEQAAPGCATLADLAALLRSGAGLQPVPGLRVTERQGPAMRTYSPFAAIKPIKTPSKWTLPHIWRAILAGQITAGRVTERLTDDYAFDAATDFGRGPCDVRAFARELIENPSGWSCYNAVPQPDGSILLKIACHTFDFRELIFAPSNTQKQAPKPAKREAKAAAKKPPLRFPDPYKWLNQRKEAQAK